MFEEEIKRFFETVITPIQDRSIRHFLANNKTLSIYEMPDNEWIAITTSPFDSIFYYQKRGNKFKWVSSNNIFGHDKKSEDVHASSPTKRIAIGIIRHLKIIQKTKNDS